MDYKVYIQSDAWRRIAEEALVRAGRKCQVCSSWKSLNVHHNTYERLGHELPTDLCVLCRKCHELFHALKDGKPTRMPVNTKRAKRAAKREKRQAAIAAARQARAAKLRPPEIAGSQRAITASFTEKGAVHPRLLKHSPHTGIRGLVQPVLVPSPRTDNPMATTECSGVLPTLPTLAAAGAGLRLGTN